MESNMFLKIWMSFNETADREIKPMSNHTGHLASWGVGHYSPMTTLLRASMRVGDHCPKKIGISHRSIISSNSSLRCQDSNRSSNQYCVNPTDSTMSPDYKMIRGKPPDPINLQTLSCACLLKVQQQCGSHSGSTFSLPSLHRAL
jgi:hypothetical protein